MRLKDYIVIQPRLLVFISSLVGIPTLIYLFTVEFVHTGRLPLVADLIFVVILGVLGAIVIGLIGLLIYLAELPKNLRRFWNYLTDPYQ